MPTRIQEMLLIFDGANLEKLAECNSDTADKLADHLGNIHAVQTTVDNPQDPVQLLVKQIVALTTKMEKLGKKNRFRSRSRNRTHKTNKVKDTSTDDDDKCYYHRKFGKQARNCAPPPCKFQNKAIQGNE